MIKSCHVDDALEQINQAEYGAHYMVIYPDLVTLREVYSNYIRKQIEDNNEVVLVNPFYETTDSVRQVLSEKYNDGMNSIYKHEKEQSLMIADAMEEYFSAQPLQYLKKGLANYSKLGRKGLSVLADLGGYTHKFKYKELVGYELSLPKKYDTQMEGYCIYHQKDFGKLSDEEKQKLIEHHGKAIKIMETQ